jgi:hypothetical protein
MPLKRCSKDGKQGWKWGDSGHCYTGKDAKRQAIRQGWSYDKDEVKKSLSEGKIEEDQQEKLSQSDLINIANDLELNFPDTLALLLENSNK